MRRLAIAAATTFWFAAATQAGPAASQAGKAPSEYSVKTAYLFNFIKYLKWPGTFSTASDPNVNVCFLGKDPFGAELALLERASTASLKLNVKRGVAESDIKTCHLLFIANSEEGRLDSILADIKDIPVATVSEIKNFTTRGGMIGFVTTENTLGVFSKDQVQFEVNLKTASAVNLKVDSDLLEFAKKVIK